MSTLAPEMSTTTTPTAGERKYYRLDYDLKRANSTPLLEWVNKKELMKDYWDKPGYLQFDSPPRIRFDRKGRRGALPDMTNINGLSAWLISDRLKALFERIDPEAFAFCKAEVDYSNFPKPGADYWFACMVRELDCVDEERSVIGYQKSYDPECLKILGLPLDTPMGKNYMDLTDVRMRPEAVGSAHAFRLKYARHDDLIDDILLTAMEKEKITGVEYHPIQKS